VKENVGTMPMNEFPEFVSEAAGKRPANEIIFVVRLFHGKKRRLLVSVNDNNNCQVATNIL
jgi:hypothetical protein